MSVTKFLGNAVPMTADGFHDHGSWQGPCDRGLKPGQLGRHRYLKQGAADDGPYESLARALAFTKWIDGGVGRGRVLCLCCRADLTEDEEGG